MKLHASTALAHVRRTHRHTTFGRRVAGACGVFLAWMSLALFVALYRAPLPAEAFIALLG